MAWQVYSATGALKTTIANIASVDLTTALTTPPPIGAVTPNTLKATTLETTGAVVFNDAGANIDLRAEGDTDTELFSLDASQDSVGVGVLVPNASAKFEVLSTAKGLLPPRMTTVQRDAISSPANGLTLYDSTLHRPSSYLNGAWYPHSVYDIKSRTVLGANATSITVALPATFNEAWICIEFRTDYGTGSVDSILMHCNSDTTAGNYLSQSLVAAAGTVTATEFIGTNSGVTIAFSAPCNTATAGNNAVLVKVSNYQSATLRRAASWQGGVQRGTTTGLITTVSGVGWWQNAANAITQVVFKPLNGTNIVTGSAYSVVGIW